MFDGERLVSFIDGFVTDDKNLSDEMYAKAELHNENGAWQMIFGVNTVPEYRCKGYAGELIKAMIEKATKEESSDTPVNLDALKEFLDSGFEKIYDSLDREEKRRLWRSVIDEFEFDGTNITGIKFKA
jgi:predicted GNAT family N-acyltransferase